MDDVTIPSRVRVRMKQRLAVFQYAETHGLKPAARHSALSRTTVRQWRDRHRAGGIAGLLPQYPERRRRRVPPDVIALVKHARVEHEFGAARARTWLQRVHGTPAAVSQARMKGER